jgi:hypothetical protein
MGQDRFRYHEREGIVKTLLFTRRICNPVESDICFRQSHCNDVSRVTSETRPKMATYLGASESVAFDRLGVSFSTSGCV